MTTRVHLGHTCPDIDAAIGMVREQCPDAVGILEDLRERNMLLRRNDGLPASPSISEEQWRETSPVPAGLARARELLTLQLDLAAIHVQAHGTTGVERARLMSASRRLVRRIRALDGDA